MHIAALILTAALAQAAPTVTTGAAESITTGSAAVTGTVNPGGAATTYQFEYGTSASYGLLTPNVDAGSGTTDVAARATLTGLTNNTTMSHPLLASFPVVIELDVGWSDMDSFDHVSNLVYFRYFQDARLVYLLTR